MKSQEALYMFPIYLFRNTFNKKNQKASSEFYPMAGHEQLTLSTQVRLFSCFSITCRHFKGSTYLLSIPEHWKFVQW